MRDADAAWTTEDEESSEDLPDDAMPHGAMSGPANSGPPGSTV